MESEEREREQERADLKAALADAIETVKKQRQYFVALRDEAERRIEHAREGVRTSERLLDAAQAAFDATLPSVQVVGQDTPWVVDRCTRHGIWARPPGKLKPTQFRRPRDGGRGAFWKAPAGTYRRDYLWIRAEDAERVLAALLKDGD